MYCCLPPSGLLTNLDIGHCDWHYFKKFWKKSAMFICYMQSEYLQKLRSLLNYWNYIMWGASVTYLPMFRSMSNSVTRYGGKEISYECWAQSAILNWTPLKTTQRSLWRYSGPYYIFRFFQIAVHHLSMIVISMSCLVKIL